MPPTVQPTKSAARGGSARRVAVAARRRRAQAAGPRGARVTRLLGRYTDQRGSRREVVARRGAAGTTLVVDHDCAHGDARLVAHLAADEPAGNAALVCARYMADTARRGRCRRLSAEDARIVPLADSQEGETAAGLPADRTLLHDESGSSYQLELLDTGMSIPELRWSRSRVGVAGAECVPVSVRGTIAALESYEPVRALTLRALSLHGRGGQVSTTVLRAELARVQGSPIVLNRRLRELG